MTSRKEPNQAFEPIYHPVFHTSLLCLSSRRHLSTSPPAPHEEFFRNTSRRWIFNETDRLNERFVKFRPTELQRIAGEAVQQDYCPDISKLPEGGFNKVFVLRARNGREVIGRIPTPIAGPPHYTTASEVATMDFLRAVLNLPVPKYILIERVEGESLSSRWLSLSTDEVKDVMTQIADMERKIFDFHFPAYGSLYYKKDPDGETQIPTVENFVIGPVSARQFWHGERSKTEIDRGPWLSPHHAKAQPRQTFLLPIDHDIHPSEHSSAPTLRDPDLSLGNVLLVPGSTKIVSIIDWQDAVIFPRFMQAGYPAFCEHDSSRPQSLQTPSLPDHFDEMDIDDQRQSKAIFRLEEANLYYTAATDRVPWNADVINLRAALVGITTPSVWSKISSAACPVVFSDEEREAAIAESQEWNESEQLLSQVREPLNIDLEGGTEPDNFERAVEGNRQFRMEMVRQAEAGQQELCWRNWPYKDKEDNSMPPQG
ncbi:putative mitochondria protein Fmp29 [Aspergillus ambiguus]|uniref:putative mitochondria protein Fmp29 n=1 Tax=Aspergillus ambiguus TaxID=176160 RepID=UPI003CCD82F2